MAKIKEAIAMVSESVPKSKSLRMEICSVPIIQRVVNFTMDDGKMYFGEHFRGITTEISPVCDLPLLFLNGFLTNLDKLTIEQLETFVPHLIQCSLSSMPLGTQPKWWPNNTEFCPRPVKPPRMSYYEWLKRLKMLVTNCYSYHGCEIALKLDLDRPLDQISLAWPYTDMPVSKISNNLNASCYMGYEQVKPVRRRSKGNECSQNIPFSPNQCFQCGSKFREAGEVRNREKICRRNQCSALSCLKVPRPSVADSINSLPANEFILSESRVRSDQQTVLINHSLPIKQRKLHHRTLTENTHLNVKQENFTSAKWSPNVLLHDCFKSRMGLKRKPESGTSKNLPLSSINGTGRKKCRSREDSHSTSIKRRVPARKSLLPLGYRKEVNKIYSRENINPCPSVDTLLGKETDNNKIVDNSFDESIYDLQSNQEYFMKCFGLIDASNSSIPCTPSKKPLGNPIRYTGVPVSSPLGSLIFNRSRIPVSVFLSKIEKVERYCSANPVNESSKSNVLAPSAVWEVTWNKKNTVNWIHNYSYPLKKWWETPLQWEKEVKRRNAYLNLLKLCKPCNVVLRRLKVVDIKLHSTLTVITGKIKKETFHNTHNVSKKISLVPEIRKLTVKEIEAYTNSVSPVLKRLSLQEINKYSQ